MSQYKFTKFKNQSENSAVKLIKPGNLDTEWIEAVLAGEVLARDLINTPANHLGPPELEKVAEELSAEFDAKLEVVSGDELLDKNFPHDTCRGRCVSKYAKTYRFKNWK